MTCNQRLLAALAMLGFAALGACIPEQNLPDPADQAVTATPDTQFHNWARGDAQIDEYDFTQAVETMRVFEMWDGNGNGVVGREEFTRHAFRVWDVDRSGSVEADEWKRAAASFYRSQQPYGEFGDWDLDADDDLGIDEVQQGFERTNLFRYWDANDDGYLTRGEFASEAFAAWDTTDNGMIDQSEWNQAIELWVMRFRRAPTT
ncbi:hypothetical protein FIV42_16975 [Persicimonas caeni]|uniref:EF-hand domain-containing protein n=1 Tax=Persicimonas caeni TaxID=2292766 RepID=A0A4Y6PVM4_PERCE|nr:hypothetical protein [Persicimonas caeni]QDG52372.1 hypothetical protein FIV42_16975 [Persicimonas caeni]QED33594.1 hypothetical protein FRD00_16970 [Persicimonas caeni]